MDGIPGHDDGLVAMVVSKVGQEGSRVELDLVGACAWFRLDVNAWFGYVNM